MKTLLALLLTIGFVVAQESVMLYSDGKTSLSPGSSYGPISLVDDSGVPTFRFSNHAYGGIQFLHNGYGGTAIGMQMPAITGGGALEFWTSPSGPATFLLGADSSGVAFSRAGSSPNGYVGRWRGRLASDPSSPTPGEIYRNTGTGKVRLWDGTVWVDLN